MQASLSFPLAAFTFFSIVISLPRAALDKYSTLEKSRMIFDRASSSIKANNWLPMIWMLFSSRIFLSMNLAIVTSPTSSMSSLWVLLPIVDFQCLNRGADREKPCSDDHPACQSRCQGLVHSHAMFSSDRKSPARKEL